MAWHCQEIDAQIGEDMRIEQRCWLAALAFCLLWVTGIGVFGRDLSSPAALALIVVGAVSASLISAFPYRSWEK